MNAASPSFIEMELTTALPCTHCKPASMISHLEESIMNGTLQISGSAAHKFKNRTMAALPSSIPSSILMSIICAPSSTWVRAISSASSYSSFRIKRLNFAEPVMLARSPTFTNNESAVIFSGSRPERRQAGSISGRERGFTPSTAFTISRICSGVVPQQPPTILTKPVSAHSLISAAISLAARSYSPNSLGKPAFG